MQLYELELARATVLAPKDSELWSHVARSTRCMVESTSTRQGDYGYDHLWNVMCHQGNLAEITAPFVPVLMAACAQQPLIAGGREALELLGDILFGASEPSLDAHRLSIEEECTLGIGEGLWSIYLLARRWPSRDAWELLLFLDQDRAAFFGASGSSDYSLVEAEIAWLAASDDKDARAFVAALPETGSVLERLMSACATVIGRRGAASAVKALTAAVADPDLLHHRTTFVRATARQITAAQGSSMGRFADSTSPALWSYYAELVDGDREAASTVLRFADLDRDRLAWFQGSV